MEKIGCCSSFKKCSDAGNCIYLDSPMYEEFFENCYYSENLAKGLNFYTEYNDNNRARAEEYKRNQENIVTIIEQVSVAIEETTSNEELLQDVIISDIIADESIDEPVTNDKYINAYIEIDNRQFYMGTRGGYKNYTYGLGKDGIDKLKESLGDTQINYDTKYDDSKFSDEDGTDKDRAEWRVYTTIGDVEYHILNSDLTALKHSTVTKVAEYLANLGFKAICECISNSRMSFAFTNDKKELQIEKDNVKEIKEDKNEIISQISLFDF